MQKTGIEWTDYSANPIKYRDADGKAVWACVKVSDGCKNCYSEATAKRWDRGGPFSLPVMKTLTTYFDEKEARQILRSKEISGKKIFIGDMTDIFGPWVPFDVLDRLFAVFALRPDVTFQVLTKRPERMATYLATGDERRSFVCDAMNRIEEQRHGPMEQAMHDHGEPHPWPLLNVHLGTSVENQKAADERIPWLLKCPAAVRFLSCEPLLGGLDLNRWLPGHCDHCGAECREYHHGESVHFRCGDEVKRGIDWAICGGESGTGSRPCNLSWIRRIVEQCEAASVPVFVKQLGSRPVDGCLDQFNTHGSNRVHLKDKKGGDMTEWSADLRVREFPAPTPATA